MSGCCARSSPTRSTKRSNAAFSASGSWAHDALVARLGGPPAPEVLDARHRRRTGRPRGRRRRRPGSAPGAARSPPPASGARWRCAGSPVVARRHLQRGLVVQTARSAPRPSGRASVVVRRLREGEHGRRSRCSTSRSRWSRRAPATRLRWSSATQRRAALVGQRRRSRSARRARGRSPWPARRRFARAAGRRGDAAPRSDASSIATVEPSPRIT